MSRPSKPFFINKNKLLSAIDSNDKLSHLRLANSPKQLTLYKIMDVILIMFSRLYSISEQIIILDNTSAKFSVTPDTYRLFLRNEMPEEYRKFKINQIFLRKINKILGLKKQGKNLSEQFEMLCFADMVIDDIAIGFEEFKLFVDTYINKPFKRKKVYTGYEEAEFVNVEDNEYTKTFTRVAPDPTTLDDIVEDYNQQNEVVTDTEQEKKQKKVDKTNNIAGIVDTDKNIGDAHDVLYERQDGRLNMIDGVTVDNIPVRYEILTNRFEHPGEVRLIAEENGITFTEDFVYIFDRELLHAADLKHFCKDNVLVVCDTSYDEEFRGGYVLYRWYKGKLYFIEHFTPTKGVSFVRQMEMWRSSNWSSAFASFIFDEWCGYKRKDL